ncbi:MAG TPA: hypothetical protein VEL06_18290 [Haliangiales bacterium]|nr:hypothetical protein [Haliangiales bacterium]
MITFLVAGRNDGYGVNLHKRTAISLNYLASLCGDSEDEIIYVDCNSPEQDGALVEAIADTLTPECRRRLKCYRVSGEQMKAALGETPLPFSDELSRNVGIRRSNPKNRWLLSTNCDILLHPLGRRSLPDLLERLPPRFYLCPRVGIPPAQWQMLDRMNVRQISDFCDDVIRRGVRFPPEKEQPWLRFGSVGDFQLAPREQWFAIRGCEEGMKLWGHSDANNAKRLNLLNGDGRTPDLGDELCVLHLNHNLTGGNAHEQTLPNNDWKFWVDEVITPLSRNGEDWGLARIDLPAIGLGSSDAIDPALIRKTHRRRRNFISALTLQLCARFWKRASAAANWLQKKSGQ